MRIAAIVPCYRVREHIGAVVSDALKYVDHVFCVDDKCPESSGDLVEKQLPDKPVTVIRNENNLGVGGAVKAGYQAALEQGYDVLIKLDGDGQMDASRIPSLIQPIRAAQADYCKGNRFYEIGFLQAMPRLRLFGNAILSLISKVSSGYWQILDPTNGFTAIHAETLRLLPLDKVSNRYFFESDLLFRLNVARAVVVDVPMPARYGSEQSSLSIPRIIGPFMWGHLKNSFKRVGYTYFLRDFSIATLELLAGVMLGCFGLVFGALAWIESNSSGVTASAGTVMLAGLTVLISIQFLLAFLNYDIRNVPRQPLSPLLSRTPEN